MHRLIGAPFENAAVANALRPQRCPDRTAFDPRQLIGSRKLAWPVKSVQGDRVKFSGRPARDCGQSSATA